MHRNNTQGDSNENLSSNFSDGNFVRWCQRSSPKTSMRRSTGSASRKVFQTIRGTMRPDDWQMDWRQQPSLQSLSLSFGRRSGCDGKNGHAEWPIAGQMKRRQTLNAAHPLSLRRGSEPLVATVTRRFGVRHTALGWAGSFAQSSSFSGERLSRVSHYFSGSCFLPGSVACTALVRRCIQAEAVLFVEFDRCLAAGSLFPGDAGESVGRCAATRRKPSIEAPQY
jgi:hypothetical protein